MAGKLTISTLNDSSGVLATQNGMTGIAKAWVSYGYVSSAITTYKSFNISSITRYNAGTYIFTFTTNMVDANYTINANCSASQAAPTASPQGGNMINFNNYTGNIAPTTSTFTVGYINYNGATNLDPQYASVVVFN